MNKKVKLNMVFFFILLCCCNSCATKNKNLITEQPTIAKQNSEKLFVKVELQAEHNILLDFEEDVALSIGKTAREIYYSKLVENLRSSKLFNITEDVSASDYELEVTILKIRGDSPINSPTIIISIVTRWSFKRNNGELIYQKDILTYRERKGDSTLFGEMFGYVTYKPMDYIEKIIPLDIQSGLEWLARRTKDL